MQESDNLNGNYLDLPESARTIRRSVHIDAKLNALSTHVSPRNADKFPSMRQKVDSNVTNHF